MTPGKTPIIGSNRISLFALAAAMALFAGCAGVETPAEIAARKDLAKVTARYRPGDAKPELPRLTATSRLKDYLLFALLNNPRIEAAYYDWYAGVESITVARSLPDPRLTFSSDITDSVRSLMPGLMLDLPGPGKLRLSGDVSAAESRATYYAFELEMLKTAYAVKNAYYRLKFLEDTLGVQQKTLRLLTDLEKLARQRNAAGRATLQDALWAQIEEEQFKTRIENLEDSRKTLMADLKAALGLGGNQADPPAPATFDASVHPMNSEDIFDLALKRNPVIGKMTAEVKRAQSLMELARKTGVPDFSAGVEVDVKGSPLMWTPSLGLTLPLWRDKIAAEIAGARAGEKAAEARLTAEQVQLGAEMASMLYMFRESERDLSLLEDRLIPLGQQALAASRAGYANGKSGFGDVLDSTRQLLGFDLSAIEARTKRELALAAISLLIADTAPDGRPERVETENGKPLHSKEDSP
jgi:outer membrane protein TolC